MFKCDFAASMQAESIRLLYFYRRILKIHAHPTKIITPTTIDLKGSVILKYSNVMPAEADIITKNKQPHP